ncbi:MAG: fatty acyl-AMP ligase [Armatimonadetes bacterium]|nr:fatty acyl-AMP ligase [Armatimonadota bacterium]
MQANTLPAMLYRAASVGRDAEGLRFVDAREREQFISWSDVRARAVRAAETLWRAGVRDGHNVALILPTCPEFIDAFFGCVLLGAVPTPLYPPVRLGRLQEYYQRTAAMLHAVQASAVVRDSRVAPMLGQVIKRYRPPLGEIPADRLAAGNAAGATILDPDPDALALIQFSSGTTVDPKAVCLTHRQVLANTRVLLELVAPDRRPYHHAGVSWLPLYHDMGLIGCILVALCRPGTLTLIPPELFLAKPAVWLRAISRHRATVSPAPNFAYSLCTERIQDDELSGVDLSSWRLALNGAEPVTAATMRAFTRRFAAWGLRAEAMTPVYGLSEATLAVTFSEPERAFRTRLFRRDALAGGEAVLLHDERRGCELVSVGRPLHGAEVEIRGADRALPAGRVGRIWVKCPWVMRGYFNREDSPVENGWLDTGDLGFLWEDELYVTGRAKDVLVIRGQNHHPQDLERALDAVGDVRTGCSAAVADIRAEGETLLVFVETRTLRSGLEEDCHKAILQATGLRPDQIILLPPGTLPRTSSGKIRRSETLQRYLNNSLDAPANVTAWSMAGELLRNSMARWKI